MSRGGSQRRCRPCGSRFSGPKGGEGRNCAQSAIAITSRHQEFERMAGAAYIGEGLPRGE